MKFSLTGLTLAFGLMASTAMAQDHGLDPNVSIDLEGFLSESHSTPYVGLRQRDDYITLDWQSINSKLLSGDFKEFSREILIEACEMLKTFKAENTDEFFKTYNIDPLASLPPDWYRCGIAAEVSSYGTKTPTAFA